MREEKPGVDPNQAFQEMELNLDRSSIAVEVRKFLDRSIELCKPLEPAGSDADFRQD